MTSKSYQPAPVDTSDITLPEGLKPLVEKIAKNVHDAWAANRLEQGWTYGPTRDDQAKTHPCLVDYDELPESEKLYDRETAISTLKLIYKFGFHITQ